MVVVDISTPTHPNTFAMVDGEDYDRINRWKWSAHKNGNSIYAVRSVGPKNKRRLISMHTEILGLPSSVLVDHRDRNGLNNQKENLRACTKQTNAFNAKKRRDARTSQYRGVSWSKQKQRFAAQIIAGPKRITRFFRTEIEAARERDRLALQYHGEFASLNFPEGRPW
jgi:hypothetical protein